MDKWLVVRFASINRRLRSQRGPTARPSPKALDVQWIDDRHLGLLNSWTQCSWCRLTGERSTSRLQRHDPVSHTQSAFLSLPSSLSTFHFSFSAVQAIDALLLKCSGLSCFLV